MKLKKILAAVAATAVALSTMAVNAFAATFEGSHTMKDSAWWTQDQIVDFEQGKTDLTALIGNLDPATVTSIKFTSDTAFFVGYNGTDGTWHQNSEAVTELTLTDVRLVEEGDSAPALHIMISKGDGVEYTINWVAEGEELAAAPAEEAPAAEGEAAPEETAEEAADEEVAAPEETAEEAVEAPADDAAEEAAPEETAEEAPAADTTTDAAATGNVAVASIAAVMAVAGAAAVATKKRK